MIDFEKVEKELKLNGFYVQQNFWSAEKCDEVCGLIKSILEEANLSKTNENDKYIVSHFNEPVLDSYRKLAGSKRPVIKVRDEKGYDFGMIDIFKIDQLIGIDLSSEIEQFNQAVQIVSEKLKVKNVNAYVNRSATSTRGYHRDSRGNKQFKAFIYLTDVLTNADGPYAYKTGTHRGNQDGKENILKSGRGT